MTSTSQPDFNDSSNTLIILSLIGILVWHIVLSAFVNLIPDECSYWAWSRRLDWSYFDNSGMVAYLIRLSTTVFGYSSPFSVRLPFIVLLALSSLVIYSSSLNLFSNRRWALISTLAFNITPVALMGGTAAIHDNILVFCTALAIWFLTRFLQDKKDYWLYFTGLAVGLSILSKYTGVLSLFCVFILLAWLGDTRKILLRRTPWLGAGIALLFTLPIIYWNWLHDWASFSHILFIGSGAVSLSRRIEDGLGFNMAQFFLISPLIYLCLVLACGKVLLKNLKRPLPEHVLCLSFGLPLLIFSIQSFRGHVEANWSIPGYIGPFLLTVWSFYSSDENALNWSSRPWSKKFVRACVLTSLSIVGLVALHARFGLIPASLERSVAKSDRIIWETRDWDKLGKHVHNLTKHGEIIAADSYQMCALLEFNTPGQPEVRYLAPWGRPTQFDLWGKSFDDLQGKTIIYVAPKPLQPSSDFLTTIYENCASVENLDTFDVMYHGESIRKIYICRITGFDPFNPRRLGPRSLFYRDY